MRQFASTLDQQYRVSRFSPLKDYLFHPVLMLNIEDANLTADQKLRITFAAVDAAMVSADVVENLTIFKMSANAEARDGFEKRPRGAKPSNSNSNNNNGNNYNGNHNKSSSNKNQNFKKQNKNKIQNNNNNSNNRNNSNNSNRENRAPTADVDRLTCFNCMGKGHTVTNCPSTKNDARITENREKLLGGPAVL